MSKTDYEKINSHEAADYGSFETGLIRNDTAEAVPVSRQRNTGSVRTVLNIIKSYIGVGILGLPNAWKESGLVGSLVAMVLLAVISLHCLLLLVQSKEILIARGQQVYSFGDVTVTAFGKFGRVAGGVVDCLLVFTQLGFCTSYIVFLGQNSQIILKSNLPWQIFAAIWIGILILISWIRTLKSLAPLATVANGCLVFGLIVISVAAMMSLDEKVHGKQPLKLKVIEWANLPSMMSIAIFSFEGVGFVIPAQTAIKNPAKYPMILTICLIIVSVMYSLFGTLCYIGFGENTNSQIISSVLEWSDGQKAWRVIMTIVTVGLMAAIAFTHPIQLFVATDILEEHLFDPHDNSWKKWWLQNNFRAFLVFATGVVALTVAEFDLILGLIGSIGAAPLQFVFPPLIALCVSWNQSGWLKISLLIFYVIFGIMALVLGAGINIVKLIDKYK